jgi:hypothetical protein
MKSRLQCQADRGPIPGTDEQHFSLHYQTHNVVSPTYQVHDAEQPSRISVKVFLHAFTSNEQAYTKNIKHKQMHREFFRQL